MLQLCRKKCTHVPYKWKCDNSAVVWSASIIQKYTFGVTWSIVNENSLIMKTILFPSMRSTCHMLWAWVHTWHHSHWQMVEPHLTLSGQGVQSTSSDGSCVQPGVKSARQVHSEGTGLRPNQEVRFASGSGPAKVTRVIQQSHDDQTSPQWWHSFDYVGGAWVPLMFWQFILEEMKMVWYKFCLTNHR